MPATVAVRAEWTRPFSDAILLLGDAGFKGGAGVGSPCLDPIGGFRE